jgi:hypothetical protein
MDRTPDGSETGGGGSPPLDLGVGRRVDDVSEIETPLRTPIDAKPSAPDTEPSTVAKAVAAIGGRPSRSPTRIRS